MWSVTMVSVWCDRTHYDNAAQICNLKKLNKRENFTPSGESYMDGFRNRGLELL